MKYTKNENVKNLEKDWKTDAYKELYEEYLGNLYKWENIDRLDELIILLDSFVGNKEFKKFFTRDEYILEDEFDEKLNPLVHCALDTMNIFDRFSYFIPSIYHHLVVANSIFAVFCIIEFAFAHYNNRLVKFDEDKVIKVSDIFYYLTFFVEDFDNPNNDFVEYSNEFYKDFFNKARKTYWMDKDVEKFADNVDGLRTAIINMTDKDFDFHNMVYMSAVYLMVCNALKNGRDSVNYDDVVVGYLTVYKMIFNDIRPLVYSLYDEDKWGQVDKNLSEYEPKDISPFENLK